MHKMITQKIFMHALQIDLSLFQLTNIEQEAHYVRI